MAIEYFIHEGDRTACDGVVVEGERRFTLNRAREGDQVTCGKNGKTYVIAGGVKGFTLNGRISAGSLDSVSTCPCRAELIPSHRSFSYEKTGRPHGGCAGIGLNILTLRPSLQGSERQPHLLARSDFSSTGHDGFDQPSHQQLPFRQRGQVSSLSIPQ